jgi:Prokaryotic E2 family E
VTIIAVGADGLLPRGDDAFLSERFPRSEVSLDGGMICVVVPEWELPSGFTVAKADLLVRLSAGFPDVQPDMWWMSPAIELASGRAIPATELRETYLGRSWQRWSRHLPPGLWNASTDGIHTYLAQIRTVLAQTAAGL